MRTFNLNNFAFCVSIRRWVFCINRVVNGAVNRGKKSNLSKPAVSIDIICYTSRMIEKAEKRKHKIR